MNSEADDPGDGDEPTQEVVVAAQDLSEGDELSEEDVTTEDWPTRYVPGNPLFSADVDIYLGQPLDFDLGAGEVIRTHHFDVTEQVAGLTGRIPTGERAVPLRFQSGVSAVRKLNSGDRIDILGTFPIADPNQDGEADDHVTMSLLQNVTVLQGGDASAAAELTVSLTPEETELLTVAQSSGELTFAARNREDLETVAVQRTTLMEVLEEIDVIQRQRTEEIVTGGGDAPCPSGQRRNAQGDCVPEIDVQR